MTLQIDGGIDYAAEQMIALMLMGIPVGDHGLKFDGDLSDGTIVNHRQPGVWTVSFRPSPGGSRSRQYTSPHAAARAIITRQHSDELARIRGAS